MMPRQAHDKPQSSPTGSWLRLFVAAMQSNVSVLPLGPLGVKADIRGTNASQVELYSTMTSLAKIHRTTNA
jgi:hypothetical protein